jgi:hypothetical protein
MRYRAVLIGLLSCLSAGAQAGVFTDDLSRCLVAKTSEADRTILMRWFFAAMSMSPSIADLAQINQAKLDLINKDAADLYSRLLLVDCRRETVAALKNEGVESLGEAGQVLGATAARGLMNTPGARAELSKFGDLEDKAKWKALAEEAGVKLEDK